MIEVRIRCFVAVFCGRNQQSTESSFILSGGLHSRAYHESDRSGFRAMGTLYSTALVTLGRTELSFFENSAGNWAAHSRERLL